MTTSPISRPHSITIPDAVYPPIPGQRHKYYGNIHFKGVKLPEDAYANSTNESNNDSESNQDIDIYEAAATGKLRKLQELLALDANGDTSDTSRSFLLANTAKASTGFTPLHYAASRGHFEVVRWLVDVAGAIVDLEDITGEVRRIANRV
jgi:hypothetical protein